MKTKRFFLSLLIFLVSIMMHAYSFKVNGIYYDITSSKTVSVTYQSVLWSDEWDIPEGFYYYIDDDGDAFYYTSDYKGNINIPSSVTYNGTTYQVTGIGYGAFNNCSPTSITIPSSVTSIGDYAFSSCGLHTLTISNSVISIGDYAFSYCNNLSVIDINATSLKSIGLGAFKNCTNLTVVNLNSIASWINVSLSNSDASPFCNGADLYVADEEKTTISFPITTTSIPAYAFYGCKNITAVNIPSQVSNIGQDSFANCPLLTSISVNASNNYFCVENDILYNSDKTELLLCCTQKSGAITLPQTVKTINSKAFRGCSSITSLTLPESLTSIGRSAFEGCTGKVTINCNIPNASSSSYSPFYNSRFSEIVIGDDVTSIGNYAFDGYSSITSLICKATTPPTLGSNNAFSGKKKIYVPYSSIEEYKLKWSALSTTEYQYLPLLDVMFFETQSADSYASILNGKNKEKVTSVAFYEGGLNSDLTETVMKNGMNPNCLYFVPSSAGLNGDNIITLDDYEAESIILTDNYTYDCPIPFHTEKIEYVHNPSVWANGSAGWETICLPFASHTFMASERGYISPIMLGSKGNFWLRKFVGASSDAVYFSSTIDGIMEANTPYLVAFPGNKMGTGHLEGQTITFIGYDADIEVSQQPKIQYNDFIFVGNFDMESDGVEGWELNSAGNSFTKSSSVGNQPFRAYLRNSEGTVDNTKLRIDFSDPTDISSLSTTAADMSYSILNNGQLMIHSTTDRTANIYGIDGKLVRRMQLTTGENYVDGLERGLYIIENTKFLVK